MTTNRILTSLVQLILIVSAGSMIRLMYKDYKQNKLH
jgi:hypothetical protein